MIYPAGVTHRPWEPITFGELYQSADHLWDNAESLLEHSLFYPNIPNRGSGNGLGRSFVGWLPSDITLRFSYQISYAPPGYFNEGSFKGTFRPIQEYRYAIADFLSSGIWRVPSDTSAPSHWGVLGELKTWHNARDLRSGETQDRWEQVTLPASLITEPAPRPYFNIMVAPLRVTRFTYHPQTGWPPAPAGMASWSLSANAVQHY